MKNMLRVLFPAIVVLAMSSAALAAGTLSGLVRLTGDGPKNPARIRLLRVGEPVAEQWAPPDGRFRFDDIEAGPYEMSVDSFGYDSTTISLELFGGRTDLVVDLKPRVAESTRSSAIVDVKAKVELDRALKEEKKGNRKATIEHLQKAADRGSTEAKALLEKLGK